MRLSSMASRERTDSGFRSNERAVRGLTTIGSPLAPLRPDGSRRLRSRDARDRIGGLRSRHEPGEGIDLIIHHQQRGAPRIDVRKLRHGFLLADDEFSYDVPLTRSLSISRL